MKTIDGLIQGSESWHQHRAKSRNASDAAAMLGYSKYKTRNELLREKFTGIVPEVTEQMQYLFDRGHQAEALARPRAEAELGVEFYPVTATSDDGYLSASFDGLTMDETLSFECKLINKDLIAYMMQHNDLPKTHYPQIEQGFLVSGATKCFFTVCDDNGDIQCSLMYESKPERQAEILAGWKNFDNDLANYKLAEVVAETVASPSLNLPSVSVQVKGEIAIVDNFKVFEVALRDFLDNKLIRKPQTDQDFADLETQVKTLKKAEDALQAAEAAVVSQVAAIDVMKRTKDMLYKMTRENRLMAEKLVASEKDARRMAIIAGGKTAFDAHIAALNTRLRKPYMPVIPADFAGAAKGLKTISSIQDKVDNELARAKIAANEVADRIDANLKQLRELASEFPFLFMDANTLVLKQAEDVKNTITARISEHKAKEQAKLDFERARIRAEEEAKARAEAEAKLRAEEEAKKIPEVTIVTKQEAPVERVDFKVEVKPDSLLEAELQRQRVNSAKKKPLKPTYGEILDVVAKHYGVSASIVKEWIEESV